MPRKATGNVYESRGRWYARITLDKGNRPSIPLPTCADETAAEKRGAVLADLARRLRAERVPLAVARELVERAGKAEQGKALDKVLAAATAICSGEARPKVDPSKPVTFRQLGERWTSGELARLYSDHVRERRTAAQVAAKLDKHVYPIVGPVPVASFTLDDAERVMMALPADLEPGSRRNIAGFMHRILSLAVFPLRLIKANPLPRGFMPKGTPEKAKGYLYPDEDARLLASPAVPLARRMFYGFLNREGCRASEAAKLTRHDFDLDRGAVKLDENKTDDPRAWALSPGVAGAVRAWIAYREAETGARLDVSAPIFTDEGGEPIDLTHAAACFRSDLRAAGITRPELFEASNARRQIRAHDMRATFITIALANGKTETWVADRTGHRSSNQINTYRRAARTAAELALGDLRALDEAIPELAAKGRIAAKGGGKGGNGQEVRSQDAESTVNHGAGTRPIGSAARFWRNCAACVFAAGTSKTTK
jgi:integrase